jgi:type I restriction enzyme S subunit
MNKHTAELLEKHFDTAFAATDGIAKLRELVLTLAMQGKLVDQDSNDPPASELLKEIEAEKQRLVKAGKIKKPKALPRIKPEEVPYQLPHGWEWVRVIDVVDVGTGSTPATTNRDYYGGTIPWYTSSATNKLIADEPKTFITEKAIKETNCKVFPSGSLVIALYGQGKTRGQISELVVAGATNQAIAAMVFFDSSAGIKKFLKYFFMKIYEEIREIAEGAAQPNLNVGKVKETLVALPPLPEQHRIVACIDQLMARCDALEKLRKEREEKRLAVQTAAIKQLLDAPDGSAWAFIQQHFGELYTVKENVAELRKAILQLAVMGRLVPQDADDSPPSELLKDIEAEKQRLVKAGTIKKPKPLPPIKLEEVPYELPRGWAWVRLGVVMQFINGDRGKNYPSKDKLSSEGIPFISAVNLSNGTVSQENLLCVSEAQYQKLGSGKLEKNDLVFCIRGSLGKKAIYPFDIGAIASSLVILRRYLREESFLHFVNVYMSSPFLFEEIRKYDNGTAQPNLSANNFMRFLLPLPSLTEQHRIVARIDQLMTLCDTLDQQIDAATGKQAEILNALMAQV